MILHGTFGAANRLAVLLASVVAVASLPVNASAQRWYPNVGEVMYDGYQMVDFHFMWEGRDAPNGRDTGYEHNLGVNRTYFDACNAVTNMPGGYDDCDTAGWFENSSTEIVFGFGTYHHRQPESLVQDKMTGFHVSADYPPRTYTWYWGQIGMGCNTDSGSCIALNTPFRVYAQEVGRILCDQDNVWCMDGIQGAGFVSDSWAWGTKENWEYKYSASTGALVYKRQF